MFCSLSMFIYAQVEMGSGSNYTEIEQDGTIEFHGEATVWNDYVVPFSSVKVTGTNNIPVWSPFMGTISQFLFEDQSASKEQEVGFVVQLPHQWDGSAIYPHIHWSPENNNSGSVVWAMEYTWVNYDATNPIVFPAAITLTTTSANVSNAGHKHLITEFAPITPNATQNKISSLLVVRFYRNSSNTADTYGSGAFALSFDIHYRMDTMGSREPLTK